MIKIFKTIYHLLIVVLFTMGAVLVLSVVPIPSITVFDIAQVPLLRYVLDFVRAPIGFVLLILIPAVIIILKETHLIRRQYLLNMLRNRVTDRVHATSEEHGETCASTPKPTCTLERSEFKYAEQGSRLHTSLEGSTEKSGKVQHKTYEAHPIVREPLLDGVVRIGRTVPRTSYSFNEALVTGYQVVLR